MRSKKKICIFDLSSMMRVLTALSGVSATTLQAPRCKDRPHTSSELGTWAAAASSVTAAWGAEEVRRRPEGRASLHSPSADSEAPMAG
jgi:hypothetical protein